MLKLDDDIETGPTREKKKKKRGPKSLTAWERFSWLNKEEVNSEAVFEQGVIIERITYMSCPPPPPLTNSFLQSLFAASLLLNGTKFGKSFMDLLWNFLFYFVTQLPLHKEWTAPK